jgi:transposase
MIQMMRRRYTKEFKAQAVELVRLGKPVAEVARELGIGSGILYRWAGSLRKASAQERGAVGGSGEQDPADQIRALQRELARLKLENDILKKAAVILGVQPSLNDEP